MAATLLAWTKAQKIVYISSSVVNKRTAITWSGGGCSEGLERSDCQERRRNISRTTIIPQFHGKESAYPPVSSPLRCHSAVEPQGPWAPATSNPALDRTWYQRTTPGQQISRHRSTTREFQNQRPHQTTAMQDLRIPANWTAAVASSSSLLQLTTSSSSSSDFEVYSCSTDSTDKLLLLSSSFNSVPNRLSFPHHARDSSLSLSLQNKGSDKKSRNKQCTHNNNQGLNPTQNTLDKRKLATPRLAPVSKLHFVVFSKFSQKQFKKFHDHHKLLSSKTSPSRGKFTLLLPWNQNTAAEQRHPLGKNQVSECATTNARKGDTGRNERERRISDQRSMLRTKR